jgi:hypothetical protein
MPRSGNYLRTVAYAFSGKYAKTPVSRAHFGQDYASNFHSRQTCASKPLQLTPLLCQKGLEIEGFWANLCFQLLQNYALSHSLDRDVEAELALHVPYVGRRENDRDLDGDGD